MEYLSLGEDVSDGMALGIMHLPRPIGSEDLGTSAGTSESLLRQSRCHRVKPLTDPLSYILEYICCSRTKRGS